VTLPLPLGSPFGVSALPFRLTVIVFVAVEAADAPIAATPTTTTASAAKAVRRVRIVPS
jgi:hypothetical protein